MKKNVLLIPCLLLAALVATAAPARPANVVIIMPDDLSFDDYSYYNKQPDAPRTPHIDRLVAESVRLNDFHVAPTCSPSRAQLMTGRYNDAAGVWHTVMGRYFLPAEEVTMADVFKANGYRTAIFGKWHLGDDFPFRPQDHGFEHVVMLNGGGIDQQPSPWGSRDTMPSTIFENGRPVSLTELNGSIPGAKAKLGISGAYLTNYFTTQAMDYIKGRHDQQEPFFAFLAYNVAHVPFDIPAEARKDASPHTAVIENMDVNIGRLLKYLDTAGLAENTLLVFILGDNGVANAMLRGDKATSYEAGHRVPCIIRWPAGGYGGSVATAREIPQMISEMDLLPTFMDVLNLRDVANRPAQVPMVGRSLKTLLDRDPANNDPVMGSRVLVVDNQRLDDLVKYKEACVMRDELDASGQITHKWRLMRMSATAAWELYDVQADLKQSQDLLKQKTNAQVEQVVASLKTAYEKWWSEISVNAANYERPIVGGPEAPDVCLFGHDWHMAEGLPPWNQTMIAAGLAANGYNAVAFAKAGDYTFDLRRWPGELAGETTVSSALRSPIRVAESSTLTYGKELPIRSARIRIWNGDKTYADEKQSVNPDSDGPVFTLRMPAGPAMVQSWFYDADGKELCGAYFNYISAAKR